MRLNALWWWIDRWRKSTAYMDMTLEEQGAYRNLLDESTLRGGPIPNDERVLAKACGDAHAWKRVRAAVLSRFTLTDEGWRNQTLDDVLRESQRRAEKQQRYRNKRGNGGGNGSGNAGGNSAGNTRGNTRGYPDPDPGKERTEAISACEVRETSVTRMVTQPVTQADRVKAFCDWYADTHQRLFRVGYFGTNRDYTVAVQLVEKFSDAQLRDAALVWFGADDDFATNGTRTITKFATRISGYLQQIAAQGIA